MTKNNEVTKIEPKVEIKKIEIPSSITTVSGKIRYLHDQGLKRGEIAKQLDKRYQHVRNVLITPLKKVG